MKLVGTRSFDFTMALKHSMSCLPDLSVHVIVDPKERLVTLEIDDLDSALILNLVTRILPEDHGAIAYADDSTGLSPAAAPFGLRIQFDGRYYRAYVSKLISGTFAFRLEGSAGERMRMAFESAPRVLEALHIAGVKAVITGSVGRADKGHAFSDLDVFIQGTDESYGGVVRVTDIAESASTVPVDLWFESWLSPRRKEVVFSEPHLLWDQVARRCVTMPGNLGSEK